MKTRIYKALSILLALMVVFSACACVLGTVAAAAKQPAYSVGGAGDPLVTIDDAIIKAISDGHDSSDKTVTVNIASKEALWSANDAVTAHKFKLVVTSGDRKTVVKSASGKSLTLGGPTEFGKVTIKTDNGFRFNDFDVKTSVDTVVENTGGWIVLGDNGTTTNTAQSVEINRLFVGKTVFLGNINAEKTYNADINITYSDNGTDNTRTQTFAFGGGKKATYNKNVNFNLKYKTAFNGKGYSYTFGKDSAVQIINSSGTTPTGINDINAPKKYILNNESGYNNLLGFTEETGKFTVNIADVSHKIIIKDSSNAIVKELVYGHKEFTLSEDGEYTVSLERGPLTHQYYVGTGDGVTAPEGHQLYATVKEAVKAANKQSGIIPKDTVQVNILGTESVFWSADDKEAMESHKFTLRVTSENGAVVTTYDKDKDGNPNPRNMTLGGPTEFGNIILETCTFKNGDNEYGKDLRLNDNDVTFSKDTVVNIKNGGNITLGLNSEVLSESQDIIINTKLLKLFMSNYNDTAKTYTKGINITFDHSPSSPTFYFGSPAGSATKTVYNNLINVNIKAATQVTFASSNKNKAYSFGSDFAIQIINSSAKALKADSDALAEIPNESKIIINDFSREANLIEATETKGEFLINYSELDKVIVTDENGQKISLDGNYLKVGAGVYNVEINRHAREVSYYVSPDGEIVEEGKGSDDLGTKENPVRSFADVTRLIARDRLSAKDTAKVYFEAGKENYWCNTNFEFPDNSAFKTPIETNKDSLIPYTCEVIIDSTSAGTSATLSNGTHIELPGDIIVKNVTLSAKYADAYLFFNHHNVEFDENSVMNVPYATIGLRGNSPDTIDEDIQITIDGQFNAKLIRLSSQYGTSSGAPANYNGNITLYINNNDANAIFVLGSKEDDSPRTFTYNGNVNIQILKAKTVSFAKSADKHTVNINGSMQFLIDNDLLLPYSVKSNFVNLAGDKGWYIINDASEDEFVKFTDVTGGFNFTSGKTAYIRQPGAEEHFAVTNEGFAVLPSGEYRVSDSAIPFFEPEASHKMLYYRTSGGGHILTSLSKVQTGKTYIFEYSIYCSQYEDSTPFISHKDSNIKKIADPEIISEEKIGNYYRIKCKATIPEDYKVEDTATKGYRPGDWAFFGVKLSAFSEGYLFDRTVYEVDDTTKTDLIKANQNFQDGLDEVLLDDSKTGVWGGNWTFPKGLVKWSNNVQVLEVVNFSEEAIAELIRLSNPNDGEWWKVEDIVEEEEIITYASAKGVFKDNTGKAVKNVKMLLISEENEYTATTNSKGEFNFGKIVTGFYELYVLNGSEKIFTGFSQYIAEDDEVTFNVTSDLTSALDYETIEPGDNVEEILPSGNLSGTVYTPYLETVANLKLYLEGIGEVTTDENGNFAFADVPVGKYKLYTVLEDGSEYVFREVDIQENVDLKVKLKYDPPKQSGTDEVNNGWIIWVIVASVVALVVVAGLVFFLVIKKKRAA